MKSAQNVQSPINSLLEAKSLEVVCFVTFLQQPVKYVTHVALFYSLFIFFKKNSKFVSVAFGLVRFDVRGLKLGSFELGIQKLESNRVLEKGVRTHV